MTTSYTKDHEWVKIEGDSAVVGITDFAQEQLGEIVYVELPELDAEFKQGEEVAVIESVKAAGEVKAPVSGKITEVNDELTSAPDEVNQNPESSGWFYRMELSNPEELDSLMDKKSYDEYLNSL